MIGFVTWPSFSYQTYFKGGQVTKLIILSIASYVLQGVKNIFDTSWASADIKVVGHTYLFAMLLLIGLVLFYTQGVFV